MHQSSPTPPPLPPPTFRFKPWLKADSSATPRDSTNDQDGDNPGNFPYVSMSAEPKPHLPPKVTKDCVE